MARLEFVLRDPTPVITDDSVSQSVAQPPTFPGIQMLRGLAAAFVVYNHVALLMLDRALVHGTSWLVPTEAIANIGAMGVDLFFVISGFVMALSARRFAGVVGAARFLLRRWIRIAPLFYLYSLLISVELLAAGIVPDPRELLNTLIFVPVLDGDDYHWPMHYLGWTLTFEWVFYLFVALLIISGERWLTWALLPLLLLLPLGQFLVADPPVMLGLLTNPMLWEFAAGVGAYLAWRANWWPANRRGFATLAAVGLLLPFAWAAYGAPAWFEARSTIDGTDSLLRVLIWGVPTLLLFGAMFDAGRHGPGRRWLLLLGDASYSLYLSHLIVLHVAQEALERWPLPIPPDALLVLLIAICLLSGTAAWALIEKPLLQFTRHRLRTAA